MTWKPFHNLRHSHATMLLKANVHPKIVSARLGHSNIQVRLDTYSHLTNSIE
ncbi:tyrosine-type recombinase/integrase [Neobacillus drentensis]|uniref:tyrosine-type recombinase/integrase n=1 Tax=Neobacillus drentensis TaxID=220684 RepID=UPI00286B6B87|nr:tyrosine-type recombinase/integrase [Neobacillus drentensis]